MPASKKKAEIKSLYKCSIAIATSRLPAGVLQGRKLAQVKSDIFEHGGDYVDTTDAASDCTHLVLTKEQYRKKPAKVHDAIQNDNVKLVSFDWLEQAFASDKPVAEEVYLLHQREDPTTTIKNSNAPTKQEKHSKRKVDELTDVDVKPSATSSKKVKAEPDASSTKNVPDAAVSKIPLDEGVNPTYQVYVSDDGIIHDALLHQTDSTSNANKFYRIQLLKDPTGKFWCWTRWGRTGERGQNQMLGASDFEGAFKIFNKKFRDKNGNAWDNRLGPLKAGKYAFLERSYDDDDDDDEPDKSNAAVKKEEDDTPGAAVDEPPPPESKLAEPVQRLMMLIFNQEYVLSTLDSLNYDANRMPLGKLNKSTLLRGYEILKDLASMINNNAISDVIQRSNQYFSIIPHDFKRNRPPVLNQISSIKKEIELLEALTDMSLANDIMKNAQVKQHDSIHLLDRQFAGLNMREMEPLNTKSKEFTELQRYLQQTCGSTHSYAYQVQDIFRIRRKDEHARFDSSKYASISNRDRRLLWHGSRCTNFGGILSQGLRIAPPEAPVSGYMFGKGIYLADMSSKSAGYCASYNSGGTGLLLLCEVELGKPPLKLTNAAYDAGDQAVKNGSISTWGVGATAPTGWKDASCVHKDLKGVLMPDVSRAPGPTNEAGTTLYYNEYIVYDIAQIRLRYLLRVKM